MIKTFKICVLQFFLFFLSQFIRFETVVRTLNHEEEVKPKGFCFNGSKTKTEEQAEDKKDIVLHETQEQRPRKSEERRCRKNKQDVPVPKEVVRKHIEKMISNLPDIPYSFLNPKEVKVDEIPNTQQRKKTKEEMDKSEVSIVHQNFKTI